MTLLLASAVTLAISPSSLAYPATRQRQPSVSSSTSDAERTEASGERIASRHSRSSASSSGSEYPPPGDVREVIVGA